MNSVVLSGRITKDPELKMTKGGIGFVSFVLAVDRDYKTKDGERPTDFIRCIAWRGLAGVLQKHVAKGSRLVVSGSLQVSTADTEDGGKVYYHDIVVETADIIDFVELSNTAGDDEGSPDTKSDGDSESALPF